MTEISNSGADLPTKRVAYGITLAVAALALAGCGGDEPPSNDSDCYSAGELTFCPTKVNGQECTVIQQGGRSDDMRCKDEPIECNASDNTSGNVCRVRVGDVECVTVLPDGGKAPKDYKDFATCPTQPRKEAPDAG